jgi:hypothetical protein
MSCLVGERIHEASVAKKSKRDPVFGDLSLHISDQWQRPIKIQFLGREWIRPLLVDIDDKDGIEEHQIQAYKDFGKKTDTLLKKAEKAIFTHYQSVCSEYRSRLGIVDPRDERVPIIKSVEDVYPLVEPEAVYFPYACSKPTWGLLCLCTWEEEHGLAVKFENGKIAKVGFQDIVL